MESIAATRGGPGCGSASDPHPARQEATRHASVRFTGISDPKHLPRDRECVPAVLRHSGARASAHTTIGYSRSLRSECVQRLKERCSCAPHADCATARLPHEPVWM
jgi:hypothetical protein